MPKKLSTNPTRFSHLIEPMEQRVLFSMAVHAAATPFFVGYSKNLRSSIQSRVAKPAAGSSNATGYTPSQVRSAYGLGVYGSSPISFGGIQGDGTGQTIALIDTYNNPNIISDLSAFDAAFNLPDPPSFKVLNQTGGTSLPTNSSVGGWSVEEALDVEWAHVMAPGANLILFEANNAGNGLYTAAKTAAATPGVSAVSMSFGGSEFSGETSFDSTFTTPGGHGGVTFLASTGDTGSELSYPALSPNVVAVGGTSLYLSGQNYSSEKAWSSGGGGVSGYESQPTYQTGVVSSASTTKRTSPDISMVADPNTGVPVYDTYDEGASTPWAQYGGTSLSAPLLAGVIAVANQGRVTAGLGTLDGKSQTLPRLYLLSSSSYHDIATGSNGHPATSGYDLATGIGTPLGGTFIPALAGGNTVTGRAFVDNNGNGIYDGSDTVLAGKSVYLDLNNNGVPNVIEPSATTSATGIYTFTDQIGSTTGQVRLTTPLITGYAAISSATLATSYAGSQTTNLNYFPTSYSTNTASTSYTLRTDPTGTLDQVLINGSVAYSVNRTVPFSLSFSLTGAGDALTVDGTNGNPVPVGGINFSGGATGDILTVIGTTSGNDAFTVDSNSLTFGANSIGFSDVSSIVLNPGAGTDSLSVNSGMVNIPSQTAGAGLLIRNFSNLFVASGASLLFGTATSHTDRTLVVTSNLSPAGTLDLGGNDMVIRGGDLASITALIASGYSNGLWNGVGLASAAAGTDFTHLTALGVISNNLYGGASQPLFDQYAPAVGDILIKYTYLGDTNLDGKVDGSDYSRIDNGYLFPASNTGWFNGDFNYDTTTDGSDYTLIDNAYNTQGDRL